MGATNVMLAYRLYAGRVPATSMQLLTYMALVSLDGDDKPWFGQGYEGLAVFALGRPAPTREADLRAVERAMKPLLDIGAIVTERRAAARRDGPRTARYRLQLVTAQAVDNHGRPTETVEDDPRKTERRPTKTVETTHENRGTEEPLGTTRSDMEENHLEQVGNSLPSTGTLDANPIDATGPDPPPCGSCGVLLDPDGACRHRPCVESVATVIPIRRRA
jgi:hypothetical protein